MNVPIVSAPHRLTVSESSTASDIAYGRKSWFEILPFWQRIGLWLVLFFAFLLILRVLETQDLTDPIVLGGLTLIIGATFGFRLAGQVMWSSTTKAITRSALWDKDVTAMFDTQGVTMTTDASRQTFNWSMVDNVFADRGLLILAAGGGAFAVPKRAFPEMSLESTHAQIEAWRRP